MMGVASRLASVLGLVALVAGPAAAADGRVTLAATVSLAPTWFDPVETPGVITPFSRSTRSTTRS